MALAGGDAHEESRRFFTGPVEQGLEEVAPPHICGQSRSRKDENFTAVNLTMCDQREIPWRSHNAECVGRSPTGLRPSLQRHFFEVPGQLFSLLERPFFNNASVFSNQASANCFASSLPVSKLTTTKPEPNR
jgi:hypothetical protein